MSQSESSAAAAPSTADVVVIGAGIVGCSAARLLARAGTDVVLVDKGAVAFEQSSRNWGWIRQNGRDLREVPMVQLSRSIWSSFEHELGVDVGWASEGNLHLGYSSDDMKMFERWCREARKLGLETAVVGREDADELFPGLHEAHVGGIFSPLDGQADPHRVTAALAADAIAEGAKVHTGCAATAIELGGDRVRSISTERGRIVTSTVIVAAGAWSSRLLWPLGVRLPQRKIRATVSATVPAEVVSRRVVWARRLAIRQDHEGSYVLAGGGGRVPLDLETLRFRHHFEGTELDTDRREEVFLRPGGEMFRDIVSSLPGGTKALWPKVRAEEPAPNRLSVERAHQRFGRIFPSANSTLGRAWPVTSTTPPTPYRSSIGSGAQPGSWLPPDSAATVSPSAPPAGSSPRSWRSSVRRLSISTAFGCRASPRVSTSEGCTSRSLRAGGPASEWRARHRPPPAPRGSPAGS